MPRSHQKPSIRDVAALAGVSYQTVSRVLNEPDRVRADTTERVKLAIDELKYRPSRAARSLARSDSTTIGVITVTAALFGPSQMVVAIDEGARAQGYATAVVTVRDDSPRSLAEAREHLLGMGVDGVILHAWSEAMIELTQLFARDLPTVAVAEGAVPSGVGRASGDHRTGATFATQALLDAGCSRIGHLAGPNDWLEARAREAGWRETAGQYASARVGASWEPESGYHAVDELLKADPDIDGIFAANDHIAIGAMRRLGELGKRVPRDIALVGYDDLEVDPFLGVPLASVRQPFVELGDAAVELLFDAIGGRGGCERVIAPTFVWRASVGERSNS